MAVDRLPIEYTRSATDDIQAFVEKYLGVDRALVDRVLEELRSGYPLYDAPVTIDVIGERRWAIHHPDAFDPVLEIDLDEDSRDIDPPAMCVFGWIQFWYREGSNPPEASFVCSGLREERPDFR